MAEDEIRAAEQRIGVRFSEDLRASYLLHNGGPMPQVAGREWYVGEVLTLEELAGLHEGLMRSRDTWCEHDGPQDCGCEWYERNGQPVRQGNTWYRGWIPLIDNGDSEYWAVDLSPLVGGTLGQVIDVDRAGPPPEVVAPSWRSYLQGIADGLDALGA